MGLFYASQRVGKGGKPFTLYKFRTLAVGTGFAKEEQYLPWGRFLRKTKLDELPSVWNLLRGDIGIWGYRPEELKTWNLYPTPIKELLSKHRPGFIDLSSLFFFREEFILQLSPDPAKTYYEVIFPMKMTLRAFYFENKCIPLNLALGWIACKKMLKAVFQRA